MRAGDLTRPTCFHAWESTCRRRAGGANPDAQAVGRGGVRSGRAGVGGKETDAADRDDRQIIVRVTQCLRCGVALNGQFWRRAGTDCGGQLRVILRAPLCVRDLVPSVHKQFEASINTTTIRVVLERKLSPSLGNAGFGCIASNAEALVRRGLRAKKLDHSQNLIHCKASH